MKRDKLIERIVSRGCVDNVCSKYFTNTQTLNIENELRNSDKKAKKIIIKHLENNHKTGLAFVNNFRSKKD